MSSLAAAQASFTGVRRAAGARYLAAQMVGSFGLAAGGTAGGLLAADMTGHAAAGPLPIGVLALGAAFSGPPLTSIMRGWGRRTGLVVGYVCAAAGALGVLVAAAAANLPMLLAASALLGAGNSAVMLTRFVLADLERPGERGRAISRSLVATTAGAIVGPNLLRPAAALAEPLGLPPVAGLYVVAVAAFVTAAGLLARNAEPSRAIVESVDPTMPGGDGTGRLALVVVATANAAMVAMMAVATVHLRAHGYDLGTIGFAVSLHVAGMFLGSPVIGRLCDRYGATSMALAGATALTAVGLAGTILDAAGIVHMAGLLVVLGVSWNIQVVAGSVLLTDAVPLTARPTAEGRAELVMGLAAGLGTLLGASPLAAVGGFRLLSASIAVASATTLARLARSPRRGEGASRHPTVQRG